MIAYRDASPKHTSTQCHVAAFICLVVCIFIISKSKRARK
jgi:hypothetical protein